MILLEVDPNLVRPGWTPLVVVVLLGIVLFFLARSMLKQFRKIDVPADRQPPTATAPDGAERTVAPPGTEGPAIPDLRQRPDTPADRP